MFARLLAGVILLALPAGAALDLKPVSPDEPADYTFNQRLSAESALRSTKQLELVLTSFRNLTEKARRMFSAKELKEIGNTDRSAQDIGFQNFPRTIQGTVLKQDYLIKKLKYELALERSKTGQVGQDKLVESEKEFKKAESAFQDFWNHFGIAD